MGETQCVVITKHDKKALEKLEKSLRLLGFSAVEFERVVKENAELRTQIKELKEERAREREDIKNYIDECMKTIQVNVSKAAEKQTAEVQKQINTYLHRGKVIDEKY